MKGLHQISVSHALLSPIAPVSFYLTLFPSTSFIVPSFILRADDDWLYCFCGTVSLRRIGGWSLTTIFFCPTATLQMLAGRVPGLSSPPQHCRCWWGNYPAHMRCILPYVTPSVNPHQFGYVFWSMYWVVATGVSFEGIQ